MAEYIEKAAILSKCEEMWNNADETTLTGIDTINTIDRITDLIGAMPVADVQPKKEWHKYPDDIPPYDGDYLCYHKGYCNVYEYFREKWFSESGEEVKQIDDKGLYWQDLPTYPGTTKG